MPSCGVCMSVCLSRSYILSKRINISSKFFTIGYHIIILFPYQTSWQYSDRTLLTGASNAGGVDTNRESRQIAGYRSKTAAVRTTTATVHRAVYRTDCHASVNLCLLQQDGRPQRKEDNRTEFICTQR